MCQCPCETEELKLEVGKTYLNRKGEKILVLYDRGFDYANPNSRFICVELKTKHSIPLSITGRFVAHGKDDRDLIKEYSEEEERKEKMQKYVDWVKSLKVDAPVSVKRVDGRVTKAHFDSVGNHYFHCYENGKTSHTTGILEQWQIIKHPDGTEIKIEDIKEWL